MEKVNELCKELRTNANLSLVDLSRLMDYDATSIRKIESGELGLSLDMANKYADLFGKQYFDELAYPLLRYDCAPLINDLLKERHISQNRFIRAFKLTNSAFLTNKRNGKPYKGYKPEEIKVLANYFNVDQSVFYNCKQYYVTKCYGRGNDSIIGSNVKIIPDPRPKEVKKTAQMICEEEKKMEYEEALKKAKEYDILEAKYKESQNHVESLTKQTDDAIKEMLRVNDVCSKLRDRVNELEKLNKTLNADYSSLYSEHDETLTRLDNLTELYNDLKASKPQVVEVIPEDYNQVLETNKRYKDVLLELLLERYEKG